MKSMKTFKNIIGLLLIAVFMTAIVGCNESAGKKEQQVVDRQQKQFASGQPIPAFDWSLERDLLIKLYAIRNQNVITHSVWRSDYGLVEGDCPSIGYGLPYDISLTNPLQKVSSTYGAVAVGQAEPNGIFASTNANATWIMCTGETGAIEPHYIESKVTGYPYEVKVDYTTNRVTRTGKTTVTLQLENK